MLSNIPPRLFQQPPSVCLPRPLGFITQFFLDDIVDTAIDGALGDLYRSILLGLRRPSVHLTLYRLKMLSITATDAASLSRI